MIILNNEDVGELLSMENCLRHLESAYKELSEGSAVNRPRSDLYLPATTTGGVYCFKTMSRFDVANPDARLAIDALTATALTATFDSYQKISQ